MSLDLALRVSEVLLALAFLQQSAEHIVHGKAERYIFLPRAALSTALLIGIYTPWVLLAMSAHSILILHRFNGPYNGGSDRMGLLVLYCLSLARLLPDGIIQEAAFGYLAIQVILSYFISGQVKIANPDWRSGRALRDVFDYSAYPVSENLRQFAGYPKLLWSFSWGVMLFEVLFPLSLLNANLIVIALIFAAAFHLMNAIVFGLNRFFWFWISAYPSLIWLQDRVVST